MSVGWRWDPVQQCRAPGTIPHFTSFLPMTHTNHSSSKLRLSQPMYSALILSLLLWSPSTLDFTTFPQYSIHPNLMKAGIKLFHSCVDLKRGGSPACFNLKKNFFFFFNTCVDLSTLMGLVCVLLFIQLARSQK